MFFNGLVPFVDLCFLQMVIVRTVITAVWHAQVHRQLSVRHVTMTASLTRIKAARRSVQQAITPTTLLTCAKNVIQAVKPVYREVQKTAWTVQAVWKKTCWLKGHVALDQASWSTQWSMHLITNGFKCFSQTYSLDPMQRVPLSTPASHYTTSNCQAFQSLLGRGKVPESSQQKIVLSKNMLGKLWQSTWVTLHFDWCLVTAEQKCSLHHFFFAWVKWNLKLVRSHIALIFLPCQTSTSCPKKMVCTALIAALRATMNWTKEHLKISVTHVSCVHFSV